MAVVGSGKHTFEVIEDWAKVPPGFSALAMAAVVVDSQDRVYGLTRGKHPVIVFDKNGNYLDSWGEDMFDFPHSIRVDPEGNIWAVSRDHGQIHKFTPEGKVLMTIGIKGYRSDTGADQSANRYTYKLVTHPGGPFNLPTDVAVSESGDIFISDGYANCQVHRFSSSGEYLYSWGQPGSGPGQFMMPHNVWIDRKKRVLVADRENDRVQVFAQTGDFLCEWPTKLVGPSGLWVDKDDVVYISEHNSGNFSVLTLDGELLTRWGSQKYLTCHGVAGDSEGNIYFIQPLAAEGSKGRRIVKYVRRA